MAGSRKCEVVGEGSSRLCARPGKLGVRCRATELMETASQTLPVCPTLQAGAAEKGVPLYRHIADLAGNPKLVGRRGWSKCSWQLVVLGLGWALGMPSTCPLFLPHALCSLRRRRKAGEQGHLMK